MWMGQGIGAFLTYKTVWESVHIVCKSLWALNLLGYRLTDTESEPTEQTETSGACLLSRWHEVWSTVSILVESQHRDHWARTSVSNSPRACTPQVHSWAGHAAHPHQICNWKPYKLRNQWNQRSLTSSFTVSPLPSTDKTLSSCPLQRSNVVTRQGTKAEFEAERQ